MWFDRRLVRTIFRDHESETLWIGKGYSYIFHLTRPSTMSQMVWSQGHSQNSQNPCCRKKCLSQKADTFPIVRASLQVVHTVATNAATALYYNMYMYSISS